MCIRDSSNIHKILDPITGPIVNKNLEQLREGEGLKKPALNQKSARISELANMSSLEDFEDLIRAK